MVPTTDSIRYSTTLRSLLLAGHPTFLTGVTGTGKTAMMTALLSQLEGSKTESFTLNFSAQSSSKVTQSLLEAKLEKKRKGFLGPPGGATAMLLFVDDVNMPTVEEYGAQPPVELLRQLIDSGGFYDRTEHYWKTVEDITLCVAAAPPGGGRNALTPRFVRHFNVFCLPPADSSAMQHIFYTILSQHLSLFRFNEDIMSMAKRLVCATIDIYQKSCEELLPIPSKCHYTFNLRDISKVFQGILMITPSACRNKNTMVRLWAHETLRVFHDRLINDTDQKWFCDALFNNMQKNFTVNLTQEQLFGSGETPSDPSEVVPPLLFGTFFRPGSISTTYEPVGSYNTLTSLLETYLEEYNAQSDSTDMRLVFFKDAMEHICRIARILSQPRGNAMLVGVGGSGKRSLTKLAAFMVGYETFSITLTRGYGKLEFREDLKKLMQKTGVEGKEVAFIFTDAQMVSESFVEDINNVLNSGAVPNLHTSDEYEVILSEIRQVLLEEPETADIDGTRAFYEAQYIARIRDRLHIVLCLSPVGDSFRIRCRQFPSLINCSTIDWFNEWPSSALQCVAQHFLMDVELDSEESRTALCNMCVRVHTSVAAAAATFYENVQRQVYVTPKSYLDLITLTLKMLAEKRKAMTKQITRLSKGVVKLEGTNTVVESLQLELTDMQPVLIAKRWKQGHYFDKLPLIKKQHLLSKNASRRMKCKSKHKPLRWLPSKRKHRLSWTRLSQFLPLLRKRWIAWIRKTLVKCGVLRNRPLRF